MLNGGFADIKGFDSFQSNLLKPSLDVDKSVVKEITDIKKEIDKAGEKKNEKLARALIDFAKHTLKASKESKTAFQTIRLPGKREVKDLRDKLKKSEAKHKTKEGQQEAKQTEGKMQGGKAAAVSRSYVMRQGKMLEKNAQQAQTQQAHQTNANAQPTQATTKERVQQLLNAFEKLVVARFEQGAEVANPNNGKLAFGEKSLAMWKSFFEGMMGRTVTKKTSLEDISNFLFRGLIQKGNGKGIVISDLVLANGKIEKFIRFSVMADALAKLKSMNPGDIFSKAALEGMNDEDLMYLALKASQGSEIAFSQDASKGKFLLAGQTEAMLSHDLGVPLHAQLQSKTRLMKRRGGFGGFMGSFLENDLEPQDDPYRFVPWWHWGRLSAPVKSPNRWVTIAFYLALLAMALIGIATMTSRLLP